MTTAYIAILVVVVGALAALPGWLALRRAKRLSSDFEAIFHAIRQRRPEPPTTPPDDGRPKRHLRIVSLWLPILGAGTWLAARLRTHPVGTSFVALAAAAATVAALVLVAPTGPPTSEIGLPPAAQPTPARRPPRLPTTPPTSVPTLTSQPGLTAPSPTPSGTPGPPPTRFPAPSTQSPTTNATTTPTTTTTEQTPTTTMPVTTMPVTRPVRPPPAQLCLRVDLPPILLLILGCAPPGSD